MCACKTSSLNSSAPGGEIADRQQHFFAGTRQHFSFRHSGNAFAPVRERLQYAFLAGVALQPKMLFQGLTRDGALEVPSSRRKLENHRASVCRDAWFKLDNLHGPPRKVR